MVSRSELSVAIIKRKEVMETLKKTKSGKSTGLDGLVVEFLK